MASILQGELYWVDLPAPRGSEPGYRRPVVVIQNDHVNASALRTILVCPLTTSLRLAGAPGNVLLPPGESDLPRASVVNVAHVTAVDRDFFDQPFGQLSRPRVVEILMGLFELLEPSAI